MHGVELHLDSVDFSDWEARKHGALWGYISFRVNGEYFPACQWYDAVSSILNLWSNAIISFIDNQEKQCYLHFMDGPYFVNISRLSEECLNISCMERDSKCYMKEEIPMLDFIECLLSTLTGFLSNCRDAATDYTRTNEYKRLVDASNTLGELVQRF